jgi:hypothetical protein
MVGDKEFGSTETKLGGQSRMDNAPLKVGYYRACRVGFAEITCFVMCDRMASALAKLKVFAEHTRVCRHGYPIPKAVEMRACVPRSIDIEHTPGIVKTKTTGFIRTVGHYAYKSISGITAACAPIRQHVRINVVKCQSREKRTIHPEFCAESFR